MAATLDLDLGGFSLLAAAGAPPTAGKKGRAVQLFDLATLQERGFVTRRSEPGSRVTKFQHHVENLLKGGTSKEVGAICVMLLRGPLGLTPEQPYYITILSFLLIHYYHDHVLFTHPEAIVAEATA